MSEQRKSLCQHPWFGPSVFALIMSGIMSLFVTGVTTLKVVGVFDGFFGLWLNAWGLAWMIAFPTLLIGRPIVTRFVASLVQ